MFAIFSFFSYLATIPAANWLIAHVGTVCLPDGGPCLIPVGFGLMAPSGVLMVGLALVLRDVLQNAFGWKVAALAIVAGAALSLAVAPPALAAASVAAFALSEALDQAIYTPLRRRQLVAAVILSGAVGAVADSALFLWLAFGNLDHVVGQIIGKMWMILVAATIMGLSRAARRELA